MKFNIGISSRKHSHDKSYHVDTTSDFGSFQPLLSEFLNPNDKIVVSDMRQLIRNGVMPAPTFGDIKCVNDFTFVPVSDIFPAYDALISGQSVTTSSRKYIPQSVPTVSNRVLVLALMQPQFSRLAVFKKGTAITDNKYSRVSGVLNGNQLVSFLKLISDKSSGKTSLSSENKIEYHFLKESQVDNDSVVVNPANADFLIASLDYLFCVRLNNKGKRLYKVLKGIGFSLDYMNDNPLSILPLFAFYKAWFDKYYPARSGNFQSTSCYTLINSIFQNGYVSLSEFHEGRSVDDDVPFLLKKFLDDLSECWYTYPTDFVSANIDTPNSNVEIDASSAPNGTFVQDEFGNPINPSNTNGFHVPQGVGNSLSLVTMQLVSRLTRFINKNSIIGGRIYEYLRIHYGQRAIDQLFAQSNFITSMTTNIVLDDTYSQADTLSQTGGSALGQRAGTGQGFSQNSFTFEAPRHGYVIGMCAIYANSQYCQGDESNLYMLKRYDFPIKELDALGYELTPLGMIYDNNGVADVGRAKITSESFGYLPTYSKYKYKRNILNGDMSKRSTAQSFLPFHLDRYIVEREYNFVPDSNGAYNAYTSFVSQIPKASDAWRFILKYPQLSYFNRIFFTGGSLATRELGKGDNFTYSKLITDANKRFDDDNFTIQCSIQMQVWNELKPLSDSFETFDPDVDTDKNSVTNM